MSPHSTDAELDAWLRAAEPDPPDPALQDDEAFVRRVMAALPAAPHTSHAMARPDALQRVLRLLPHLQALALGGLLAWLLALWPDQALALAAGGGAALEAGLLGLCGLGLLAWWSLPQAWASPWR
ncbi:hypothetical protein [Inhella gelatinilytica]|uniref:Uncharacterized protein n=1 Tax=Inhella gelatinilytica TaxID=2795030 RepID=A0A931NFN0_9BURK|nr:hypothetical protein [Inhella gelatinilytica]MBH9553716.1 hypothetical protein [Inhella gelatinilytica]